MDYLIPLEMCSSDIKLKCEEHIFQNIIHNNFNQLDQYQKKHQMHLHQVDNNSNTTIKVKLMKRPSPMREKSEPFGKTGLFKGRWDITSQVYQQCNKSFTNPERDSAIFPLVSFSSSSERKGDYDTKQELITPILKNSPLQIQHKLRKLVNQIQQKHQKKQGQSRHPMKKVKMFDEKQKLNMNLYENQRLRLLSQIPRQKLRKAKLREEGQKRQQSSYSFVQMNLGQTCRESIRFGERPRPRRLKTEEEVARSAQMRLREHLSMMAEKNRTSPLKVSTLSGWGSHSDQG